MTSTPSVRALRAEEPSERRTAGPERSRHREPPGRAADLPARSGVRGAGQRAAPSCTRRPTRDPEAFWAKIARETVDLERAVHDDARMGPAVREVVRRRQAQHQRELRRPARRQRPRRQGRLPLDRRARRHPDDHLRRPAPRGLEGRQRPPRARDRDRRPGRDLHADDPGAADRDARLRPDRRAAHGRLRGLLRRGAGRPHQRRRGEARHHRRRQLSARQGDAAQGGGRRGRRQHARRSSTC